MEDYLEFEKSIAALEKKIIDLEHVNSLLSDNLDPDYIDILIREKFMFGKKGESTYIVNNDS